jgi:REP element-mobilizing transposase RayT
MKQLNLMKKSKNSREHGGTASLGKRKTQRALSVKRPIHLVLKSQRAVGKRNLLRHRTLIENVVRKAQRRFSVRIYEMAVVSNHIHLLVKGYSRTELQNFFRVVAGHIAQKILQLHPLLESECLETGGAQTKQENKFWLSRVYTRIVTWGREFVSVKRYVIQNVREALGIIEYKPRKRETG